jgi:polysaccharide deacetylase family protein (PEP-CTERM system associated)
VIIFTVDVEDWTQSSVDFDAEIGERCARNTTTMLELFDRLDIRGTWFVQGLVARRHPSLVRDIARRGHEVGCHAHTHRPLHAMSRAELDREIATARAAIEDAIGEAVVGFRAPDFSLGAPCDRLDQVNREIFAVLAAHGFRYDSSVVPARMRRYGVASAPRGPFWLREGLLEIPLATVGVGARRWPALGGGYLRLFPLAYHQVALWQADRAGDPQVVYLHPYELDTHEVRQVAKQRAISWKFRLGQELGRGPRLARRIGRLRRRRPVATMAQTFRALEARTDLATI